jgi:hypothetical protein
MQSIESASFNEPWKAKLLYALLSPAADNAEKVIDQYTLATGRDLKSQAVSIVPRASTSSLPMPRRQSPMPQLAARPANGHGTLKQ